MIRSSQINAFYLFDVAESVQLDRVAALLQTTMAATRLPSKPPIPSYVRYQTPPLQVDGDRFGFGIVDGFQARVKVFDYGILSLSLSRSFAGTWDELITIANDISVQNVLDTKAEALCRQAVERIRLALDRPRTEFLSEDYCVFSIHAFDVPLSAERLLELHGTAIAQLLRAEVQPLAAQERDEILRHRLSYLADDLVVPTWSTALVYDTEAGAQAGLDIF